MNQSEQSLSGFSPYFKAPDLDVEKLRGREQASALRDLGLRSFCPLCTPLSISVYDRH